MAINYYDSTMRNIHNYYRFATHVSLDCNKIQWQISTLMKNRLKGRLKRTGSLLGRHIKNGMKKANKCASLTECQFVQ